MSDTKTAVDAIKKSIGTMPKTIPQANQKDVKAYLDAANAVLTAVQGSADSDDAKRKRELVKTSEAALTTAKTKVDTAVKLLNAATADRDGKSANVTGAKAQLAEAVAKQVKSLESAKAKLSEVTQAAQKVSTALKGQTQSPQKDIVSSVTRGYLDIAKAVNGVDTPQ